MAAGPRSAHKRAAPAADAEASNAEQPAPKRAKRGAKAKQATEDDIGPDSIQPPKATKTSAKEKAKTIPLDDEDNEEAVSTKPRAKAKAINTEADENTAVLSKAKLEAKPKGKGKAKSQQSDDGIEVKAEDAQADTGAAELAADAEDVEVPPVSDAQFAKAKNLQVQVDEECQMPAYKVHIDSSSGIIYDASLNQTNAGNNHNKFYKIQLLTDGYDFQTYTRWGRVGERGQSAVLGNGSFQDALSQFDKKFKDKTGLKWDDRGSNPKAKKYVFIEKSYEADSEEDEAPTMPKAAKGPSRMSPPKCTLQPQVKSLMELVFNQQYFEQAMQDMNYDPEKLPLGKLSKATITRGYQTLKDLSALLSDPSLAQSQHGTHYNAAVEDLSNRYI